MRMGVSADLQIGEDDPHMSTSNIWLNMRRSASCKGAAQSVIRCDIGQRKKKKLICLCAPTTHAGSFKCRLHRATGTANSTAHKPLASCSLNKKSFSSRNMALSRTGNLDVQPDQPRLSRFGWAVAAANGSAIHPISPVLEKNEQFYEPHQDVA